MGEHLVHQHAQHVADGHQLEQAQRHQPQAAHGAPGVEAVFLPELGQQRPGPADGPLGDGGEKVQKQRAVDGVFLHLTVAACRVDQVGDGREAVKTDAQRHGHGLPARQPRKGAVVFEKRQHRQQPRDARAQRGGLAGPFQRAAAQVSQRRDGDGHRQHGRHRQPVEQPAGRQQEGALGAPGQMQVDGGHHQQKPEEAETLQTQGRTSDAKPFEGGSPPRFPPGNGGKDGNFRSHNNSLYMIYRAGASGGEGLRREKSFSGAVFPAFAVFCAFPLDATEVSCYGRGVVRPG